MATPLTTDDIAVLLGRTLTPAEEEQIELYIELAEGEIETWLGRPIKPKSFTENCFPDGNGVVYLKNTPVISVSTLVVNGESVDDNYFLVTPYGLDNVFDQNYNIRSFETDVLPIDLIYETAITVTYRAGLDYPNAIRSLLANAIVQKFRSEAAKNAKESAGQTGVKIIKVDDYQVEYFNDNSSSSSNSAAVSSFSFFPSEAEFSTIKRFKRQGVTY